ncbi:MAG: chromate reductase [Myxococcota bacterium]|jgi:chromate reductase
MTLNVLAISGSLRNHSHNTALLNAATIRAPEGLVLTLAEIGDLPLYNSDLDAETVPSIGRFKAAITQADAVLIATPEYNYGIPGPLKNAIDWASRPGYKSPFANKPVGILGAAASVVGSARAQAHLKTVMLGMIAQVFPRPEFLMGKSFEKVQDGVLTDEMTLEFLGSYLAAFKSWVERVSVS